MQKVDGTTIKLNRGDVLNLNLTIQQEDDTDYVFQDGDIIYFSIYNKGKMSDEAILLKEITPTANTTSVNISLTNEDTKIGELINKPKEYWYEIELNDEQTVIGYDDNGPKLFILYPEGSKQND